MLLAIFILITPLVFSEELVPDPEYFQRSDTYVLKDKIATPIDMRFKDAIDTTYCGKEAKIIMKSMDYDDKIVEIQIGNDIYGIYENNFATYDINSNGEKDLKIFFAFLEKGEAHLVVEGLYDCNSEPTLNETTTTTLIENKTTSRFIISASSYDSKYWKYGLYTVIGLIVLFILFKFRKSLLIALKKLKPKKKSKHHHEAPEAPRIAEHVACVNCGRDTIKGDKFCINCGEKLREKKHYCINCGFELRKDSKFCPDCGEKSLP